MKWPEAVEAWSAATATARGVSARAEAAWPWPEGRGVSASPGRRAARRFFRVKASASVAKAVSGKPLWDMHSAISRGSAGSALGVQMGLRRLGVCADAGGTPAPAKNLKKRKRSDDPGAVHLGKCQSPFRVDLVGGAKVWKAVLDMDPLAIDMPQTPEELARAIALLDEWLRCFPSEFQQGGARSYIRMHIARKFVMSMSRRAPRGAMRAMRWAELVPANADKQRLTAALPSDATWGDIEDQFGMHPLMIAAWCCSLGGVPDKSWHHFENPSARVREVALGMQRERGGLAPNARELAERLG